MKFVFFFLAMGFYVIFFGLVKTYWHPEKTKKRSEAPTVGAAFVSSKPPRQVNHVCGRGLKYLGSNSGVDGVNQCVQSSLGRKRGGGRGEV